MDMMINGITPIPTNDHIIRAALKTVLKRDHENQKNTIIVEELGLEHGESRVDVAVINGCIHGYELKSDRDNLNRLPNQMRIYNTILDKVTLVVGKEHLYDAFKIIPDWWGVVIAKATNQDKQVTFINIRDPNDNPSRDSLSIAKLLWKDEAFNLLREMGQERGMHSKPRRFLYEYIAANIDQNTLRTKVRQCLYSRINWRSDLQQKLSGG